MYVPAANLKKEVDQEIVCLFTGESYVFLEGDEKTLTEQHEGAIDSLPSRFYKLPFIKRSSNGQIRVFGSIE
jgi:hypothetical protein